MTYAPSLETRPGRPREVSGTSWWVDHPDGSVSYVIVRRAESGAPNGMTLAFHGTDERETTGRYEEWLATQGERVVRQAERRSKWGILGTGKVT